ncbi:hypothetical protein BH09PLA1_BH09PLA1_26040 [soil metagenome]
MSDPMNNAEAGELMKEGFELLCNWSRMIAMLPLEDWQRALDHAETVGPIVDPTLMREYLYSDKPAVIKSLLDAAIPLKRAVLKAQPVVLREALRKAQ